MVAGQPAALARDLLTSFSGRQAVHPDPALLQCNRFGPADQGRDLRRYRSHSGLYPVARLFEEVQQHCNCFINSQLFKVFSEPAGYMGAFCRTRVTQLADFTAPECQARLELLRNGKAIL